MAVKWGGSSGKAGGDAKHGQFQRLRDLAERQGSPASSCGTWAFASSSRRPGDCAFGAIGPEGEPSQNRLRRDALRQDARTLRPPATLISKISPGIVSYM
jgi:hypothetical protein